MIKNLNALFKVEKPIIGMIHLAGEEPIKRALEELCIYEEEGVNGAIIEDYHGTPEEVYETLKETANLKLNIIPGINILRNPYSAFELASTLGAKFIQFDSVQTQDLYLNTYNHLRNEFSEIFVLGGVGFKYIPPTGNPLETDLNEGKSRCDSIVTTGEGTGIETPLEKLRQYKKILKDFPLIVGAGVNSENISSQLSIADGAIIGSAFKINHSTYNNLDILKIREIMRIVKEMRNYENQSKQV